LTLVALLLGDEVGRNPVEVQEIAGLAVLLASPSGGYINGQTMEGAFSACLLPVWPPSGRAISSFRSASGSFRSPRI